jgi:hypothetical protein
MNAETSHLTRLPPESAKMSADLLPGHYRNLIAELTVYGS